VRDQPFPRGKFAAIAVITRSSYREFIAAIRPPIRAWIVVHRHVFACHHRRREPSNIQIN
jgi:hypothetical protein